MRERRNSFRPAVAKPSPTSVNVYRDSLKNQPKKSKLHFLNNKNLFVYFSLLPELFLPLSKKVSRCQTIGWAYVARRLKSPTLQFCPLSPPPFSSEEYNFFLFLHRWRPERSKRRGGGGETASFHPRRQGGKNAERLFFFLLHLPAYIGHKRSPGKKSLSQVWISLFGRRRHF